MTPMHDEKLHPWQHSHSFGQEKKRPGESRTLITIVLTGTMMVVEIAAGILFGSMALLADGLHMASHTAALSINAFAYIHARKHAHDEGFCFGTGKVNALGGFTGAVLLAVLGFIMAWESVHRLFVPVPIALDQAILVAFLGLVVNGVSVFILSHREPHPAHEHEHELGHEHHEHDHEHHHGHDPHDFNLRSAYLHVLTDALTSVLAIFALLAAKYFGLLWMDPLMGVLGAILVARWSLGLLRNTSAVLLDRQAPDRIRDALRRGIEREDGNRVADLHVWSVGPSIYAAALSVVTHEPKPPEHYKAMVPSDLGLVHVTVEVHRSARENESP